MQHPLLSIPQAFHAGRPIGITSVCSAHPLVIEAALRHARELGLPALIEATCNQVNQDGGYTGMTPEDFRSFVGKVAADADCRDVEIILGGDHLGPNPWKHLPADDAMAKADAMIAAFARAGFTKLHLDTSMGCAGEPSALDDRITAERAARLAKIAEAAAPGNPMPVYVIGTEVPIPGGATEALDHLEVTDPAAVRDTYDVHQSAFADAGVADAFDRVIALVVQPGVEFGHSDIVPFDPAAAAKLTDTLRQLPGIVFEAHSTDYQTGQGLSQLVSGGFGILKVGPWLTFAVREALYGLDAIADVMEGTPPKGRFMQAMEDIMLAHPVHWETHYTGNEDALWLQRHFSLSDRIRYYWPAKAAEAAVAKLLRRLEGRQIPGALAQQYLPAANSVDAAQDGRTAIIAAVQDVLSLYAAAGDRNRDAA